MDDRVLALDEIGEADRPRVGGKAANLGELSRIPGVQVPAGFCVTTAAYAAVTGSDGEFARLLHGLGRLTTAGIVTYFVLTPGSGPRDITLGSDGAVWFTETNVGKIGRAAPDGTFDEFTLPSSNAGPNGITTGPDGNLWFTEITTSRIGRLTPAGGRCSPSAHKPARQTGMPRPGVLVAAYRGAAGAA